MYKIILNFFKAKKRNRMAINEQKNDIKQWNEIWEDIYLFQKTIPQGLEATEENAQSLGLMILTLPMPKGRGF